MKVEIGGIQSILLFCGLNGNVVNVYNPDAFLWAKYEVEIGI